VKIGLGKSFAWTLLGKAALLLGGVITAALVNRALAPAGRGFLAEIQTWAAAFAVIFGFSLDTAIYHFANRQRYVLSDSERLTTVLATSLGAALIAVLFFAALVAAFPGVLSPSARGALPLLVALLLSTLFFTNLQTLAQATGNVRTVALTSSIQAATALGLIIPAFFVHRLDLDYVLMATVLAQMFGIAAVVLAFRRSGVVPVGRLDRKLVGEFLLSGLKQHVATISTFAYTKVNQLLVFNYAGEAQAGMFAAALTLAFWIFGGFSALQLALYPRTIHFADDLEVTVRTLRIAFYSGGLLCLGAMLFAKQILMAYGGAAFVDAAPILRLMILSAWFLSMSSLVAPYYVKHGAFRLAAATAILLGLISVAINLWLVPSYQAIGAAAATAMTTLLGFGLVFSMLRILSGRWLWRIFRPDFRAEMAGFRQRRIPYSGPQ